MQLIPYVLIRLLPIDNQESDIKTPLAGPNRFSSSRGCSCDFDSQNSVKSIPVDARHLLTLRSKRVLRVVSITTGDSLFSSARKG